MQIINVRLIVLSLVLQRNPLSVVEVWKGGCYLCKMRKVTKAGLRVILASPWYLDQPGSTQKWARYYNVWPLAFKGQSYTCVPWLVEVLLTAVFLYVVIIYRFRAKYYARYALKSLDTLNFMCIIRPSN